MPSRLIAILTVLLLLSGCGRGRPIGPMMPESQSPARPIATAPPAAPLRAQTWPALDHEPELGVLLLRGSEVRFRLLLPCVLADGHEIPAGAVMVRATGDGFLIAGRRIAGPRATLTPRGDGPVAAIGSGKSADRFAGSLLLVRSNHEVELVERVGLETWLAGVLPAEMNPEWPVAALAAQAIAARSYAAARWQSRHDEAWHLVRGTADIAYDGAVAPSRNISEALASSRGLVLGSGGQAILARFHACSGGRTEASSALWPDATLADGTTPLDRFMRPVDDPVSEEGSRGLGWTTTHEHWRAALPLEQVSAALKAWSAAVPTRPRIGQVVGVRISSRQPGSERVAKVEVIHRGGGGERSDVIDALEFRLAVGANHLRSLWWESVTTASAGGGQLVVKGRGFGHGVGLPQVSAWALAKQGVTAEAIIARYYPGASLVRMWR